MVPLINQPGLFVQVDDVNLDKEVLDDVREGVFVEKVDNDSSRDQCTHTRTEPRPVLEQIDERSIV